MGMKLSLEKEEFSQDEIIKAKVTIDNSKSDYKILRVRFYLNMVIAVKAEAGTKTKYLTLVDLNYPEMSAGSKLINKPYFIDLKTSKPSIGQIFQKEVSRSSLSCAQNFLPPMGLPGYELITSW